MWSDIVTTALIGTERQKLRLADNNESPLMQLLTGIDNSDGEKQLLDVAATVALYRRVGSLPSQLKTPLMPPCDKDDLPVCAARVTHYLDRAVSIPQKEILQELLLAIARVGKRVPDSSLITLLALGKQNRALRNFIIPILGKRGHWLAAHNRQWQYVGATVPDNSAATEIWQTADRATRTQLLRDLRVGDPVLALNLLTSSWQSEPADDRSAFIETFELNLSMADEPFLEDALSDRRKEVRKTATNLLQQLSASRYVQRMIARVEPLIKLIRNGDKYEFEIELPVSCDKAMLRDGIELKPDHQHKHLGERGWWLQQMLSTIPPSHWSNLWSLSAKELIAAARETEWRELFMDSWCKAAITHSNVEWAESFLIEGFLSPKLIEITSSEFMEGLIFSQIDTEPIRSGLFIVWFLSNNKRPWSERLSRHVIEKIREHITLNTSTKIDWALQEDFKLWVSYFPPDLYDELWQEWPRDVDNWQYWSEVINQFFTLLKLRQEMLKEINR